MRLSRLMVLFALVCAAASAQRASAQQVAYAANVMGELDSASAAAVSREIARARDRGIPVEPLLAKVREGRLKSAGGPLIRTAVARLAERLDSARAALGASSSSEELVAGADALQAGAGAVSLQAVRAATTHSVAAPLGTLAQLVLSGVKPPRAVEMIVSLLRRNAGPGMVLALGNLVEADVAAGIRADESAVIRLRGIEGSLGFGDKVELTAPAVGTSGGGNGGTKAGPPKRRP